MVYDPGVVKTAYDTAKRLGASDKVMLALFEAAIVESGFRNLSHGDRDSVGFLQQRPSQGWPNPTDVATATTSFVNKAMVVESQYATAGQLAQAIQRSALPLKYDAVRGPAAALLAQTAGNSSPTVDTIPTGTGTASNVETLMKALTSRGFWVRYGTLIIGVVLVLVALIQITGAASAVGSAAGKAVDLIPGGTVVKGAVKVVKAR